MEESHLLSCGAAASSPSAAARLIQSSDHPSLDLQLSISLQSKPPSERGGAAMRKMMSRKNVETTTSRCVEALKWQAAEQLRLAAMEKAYAERVRELTRREMELAQSEFTRARAMRERARDEVQRAERMKDSSLSTAACMSEITCHSCRHKFRP